MIRHRRTCRLGLALGALSLLVIGLAPGCKKTTKKYYTTTDATASTDAFPGTPTTDNNVGDDGQAFNDSGHMINHGLNVFWNAANGTAVVLYLDEFEALLAQFFDGTGFTPAVELRGPNQRDEEEHDDDDLNSFEIYRVLFLNTAASGNGNAQARNGDALIAWVRADLDPPAGMDPDADSNDRLFVTYFDRSLAGTAVSSADPTVRYGFETVATIVDFDNQVVGSDDDVSSFGFVSNSLRFTHAFDDRGNDTEEFYPRENGDIIPPPATQSGDPTSFVYYVWRKEENDTSTSLADRFHALEFDLTQAGNAIPVQASADVGRIEPPVPVATLDPTQSVTDKFMVHNNAMIWRGDTVATEVLFVTRFASGVTPETIELGNTIATPGSVDVPHAQDVYGGDHDLLAVYAVFLEGSDLFAAQSDLDESPLNRETQAIDSAVAGISSTFNTRINRTRQWVFAQWLQDDGSGFQKVTCNAIQTRNSGATADRLLSNSVATAAAVPNQSTSLAQDPVIQFELATGRSDHACGVQSNHNRINFAYLETTASLQSLIHNGLIFTAGANPTTPPTAAFAITTALPDGRIDQNDVNYQPIGSNMLPIVTDLGTSAGDPLLYYLRNDNNPTDDTALGAFDEVRVFGCAAVTGAVPAIVSTDGTDAEYAMNDGENFIGDLDDFFNSTGDFFRVQTTPLNRNIGTSPDFGGSVVHLFFREPHVGEITYPALRTRRFVKASFSAATPATFGTAHVPALTSNPMTLDTFNTEEAFVLSTTDNDGDRAGPLSDFVTTDGLSSVGIYFQNRMHMLYQEFNGSSWLASGGAPAPAIVDAVGGGVFPGRDQQALVFGARRVNSCNTFNSALVFYAKSLAGDDPHSRRWFVRIHN